MTKQDKTEAQNQGKQPTKGMRLRSAGNLIEDQPQIVTQIKKPSLIMDRELDEMKIIKQFQIKRKLLMKALKQKQKEKSLHLVTIESFSIKEGIHQNLFCEPKTKEFGISTINEADNFKFEPNPSHSSNLGKVSVEPKQRDSQKNSVGIQTVQQIGKTKKIKKADKQSIRSNVQDKDMKSLKENQVARFKRTKKTPEDIERIRNQITCLLVNNQTESQFHTDSNSSSYFSSCSLILSEIDQKEVISSIQKLNNETQSYYEKRYLREVILKQYEEKFNPKKSIKYNKQQKQHFHLQLANYVSADMRNLRSKLRNTQQNLSIEQNGNIKRNINNMKNIEVLKNDEWLNRQKHQFGEIKNDQVKHQQKQSRSNVRKRHKRIYKRRLLNQRFKIVVEKQSSAPLIKEQALIRNQQENNNPQVKINKAEKSDSQNSNSFHDFYDDQSDEETNFSLMENWVQQFKKQTKVIYEKYPRIKQLYTNSKQVNLENKQIQLENIEKYCTKKKKIGKPRRKMDEKQSIKKSFKQKLVAFIKSKDEKNSELQKIQKRLRSIKKKPIVLKKIQIGKGEQEEFCKSFDHRTFKPEKGSIRFEQDLNDISINDIFEKSNQISHEIYSESQSEKEVLHSRSQIVTNTKISNLDKEDDANKSQSQGATSSSHLQQSQQSKKGSQNKDWSFFKSRQGKDYFLMSGEIN